MMTNKEEVKTQDYWRSDEFKKKQKEVWAAEDAKWKKFDTPYNRAQMIDWCEGEIV
tara:strand:+ start:1132 stop:1299 length:168 start_codon:yes stop_codon:yes gene_type:complete